MRGAYDYHPVRHHWWRTRADVRFDWIHRVALPLGEGSLQIDHTALSEALDLISGLGIQSDQVRCSLPIRALGTRDATPGAHPRAGGAPLAFIHPPGPEHLSRSRVDGRNGPANSGRGVENPIHHQGSRPVVRFGPWSEVPGPPAPRDLQLVDVLYGKAIEGLESSRTRIPPH